MDSQFIPTPDGGQNSSQTDEDFMEFVDFNHPTKGRISSAAGAGSRQRKLAAAFSASVVSENGMPIEVYHATTADFGQFDIGRANPSNRFGPGFYFTRDRATMQVYAGGTDAAAGGSVMPVYLNICKPQTGEALTKEQVEQFFAALQDTRIIAGPYV